jgi:hypothetical protein
MVGAVTLRLVDPGAWSRPDFFMRGAGLVVCSATVLDRGGRQRYSLVSFWSVPLGRPENRAGGPTVLGRTADVNQPSWERSALPLEVCFVEITPLAGIRKGRREFCCQHRSACEGNA